MTKPIIEMQNLGKRYRIGGQKEKYLSLREEIVKRFSPAAWRAKAAKEAFWALKGVDINIRPGETVGIIGRNGAGKSTLLKVLSRITPPTEGRIVMRGRVASLLEVGTGFHPELTGRENIFLNGAILGMRREEIRRKFDEIVAFAEIEKFLETPVKRYSSGMYVRLAFAVAAHLEPEILVVDEVLAVGDGAFQTKCLTKMNDVARGGRTILFVSHNMGAVKQLCARVIWLKDGQLIEDGITEEITSAYFNETRNITAESTTIRYDDNPEAQFCIRSIGVSDSVGNPSRCFHLGSQICIDIEYFVRAPIRQSHLLFKVSRQGVNLFQSHDTDSHSEHLAMRNPGRYLASIRLPGRLLAPGQYTLSFAAAIGPLAQYGHDLHVDALGFTVEEGGEDTSYKGYAAHRGMSIIMDLDWKIQRLPQ